MRPDHSRLLLHHKERNRGECGDLASVAMASPTAPPPALPSEGTSARSTVTPTPTATVSTVTATPGTTTPTGSDDSGNRRGTPLAGMAVTPIILSQTGQVRVTITGASDLCSGNSGIDSPADRLLISNYSGKTGTSVDVGIFAAGTELVFYISPGLVVRPPQVPFDGSCSCKSDFSWNGYLADWLGR